MLKQQATVIRRISVFFDIFVTAISFVGAYYLRNLLGDVIGLGNLYPLKVYIWWLYVIIPLWWVLFNLQGIYKSQRITPVWEIAWKISKAIVYGVFISSAIIFFLKAEYFSRTFFLLFAVVNFMVLVMEKVLLVAVLRIIRKRGLNYRMILIVGTGGRAQKFVKLIEEHDQWGFKVFGFIDKDIEKVGKVIMGVKVLGTFKDIPEIIVNQVVDEVIFCVPRRWLDSLEEVLLICEEGGVKTRIAVDFYNTIIAKTELEKFHGVPLLTFTTTPQNFLAILIKRLIDIAISLVLLLVLSPLFIIVTVAIKLTSDGPLFFKQVRCGLNGRKFILYKFRSMVFDAEEKMSEVKELNEMDGPVFKIKDDPRVTKVGKFIRKLSIDELPQLFNVFKGDMSLVGPRPPIPTEVKNYQRWQRRRLSMKPGITCLWQINGRNKVNFEEWMRLDLEYIDNWSLWLDVKIFFKTVPVVLLGVGAS